MVIFKIFHYSTLNRKNQSSILFKREICEKKITMSTEEQHQSETINQDDELIVTNEPVMKTAIDVLSKFSLTNKLVLKAYGEIIPNAVAIANIITENILKGNSKIDKIFLDSEISEEKGMISNIQITLLKN